MPPYLDLVRIVQILGHGLDNQLKEEPRELKPGGVQLRSILLQFCIICSSWQLIYFPWLTILKDLRVIIQIEVLHFIITKLKQVWGEKQTFRTFLTAACSLLFRSKVIPLASSSWTVLKPWASDLNTYYKQGERETSQLHVHSYNSLMILEHWFFHFGEATVEK